MEEDQELCNGDYQGNNGVFQAENLSENGKEVDCSTVEGETLSQVGIAHPQSDNSHQHSNGNGLKTEEVSVRKNRIIKTQDTDEDCFSEDEDAEDILFDVKATATTTSALEECQPRTEVSERNVASCPHNEEGNGAMESSCSNSVQENIIESIKVSSDICTSVNVEEESITTAFTVEGVNGVDDIENPKELHETMTKEKDLSAEMDVIRKANADLMAQLEEEKEKKASMDEVVKEVEKKCFQQQERIEELELKLEDATEKARLEHKELQEKIEEVQLSSTEAGKARDGVINKLAVMQEEHRNLIDQVTDKEKRVRELSKESEKLEVLSKKQRAEVLKLQGILEKSEARCTQLSQDLNKQKEEVNSFNIKLKWAQNKLRTESEAHKTTKAQLDVVTKKLNQAKEEGDMIRADLKKMINQYQESEEMRSNSLDIKLKKTEEELKQHEQEIADQHELHELTVKELELTKASHKIAQEEIQQRKQKMTEMSSRATELVEEIEDLNATIAKLKQDSKKQNIDASEYDQKVQAFEKERVKFSQLRDVFTQLQKSHQHIEKEVEKMKERETELLAFSGKLSSSNAELMAERADWEAKLSSLSTERDALTSEVSQTSAARSELQETLEETNRSHQEQVNDLLQQLDSKSRAVEELSISLEDERELVKATKKKNTNLVKDLQRQLQNSNRRVEHLEANVGAEKEPAAMLPISHAHSSTSLDAVVSNATSLLAPNATMTTTSATISTATSVSLSTAAENSSEYRNDHLMRGTAATIPLSDDERGHTSPSPEYKFYNMDQEKIMLVEKMCHLKKELAKQEEKAGFYEDHISQLTDDIKKKSRIIQSFIVREQSGALAPPSFDENRIRQAKKGGVMGTVFSGKNRIPEVNLDLSLEMNRKMQCVLEDTLLKNITLMENIDTLGQEIQRMSAQLQKYEKTHR